MDIRNKTAEIIAKVLANDNIIDYLLNEGDLTNIRLNSISYIKMIVDIEREFDIEFDDNVLDFKTFNTFNKLCNYIKMLIETNQDAGLGE